MHDEIAGGEAREFGNEILGATGGAPWPHEPIAENVLFADECRPCGLEAAFHSEHRKRHMGLRQRHGVRPGADSGKLGQRMIRKHVPHALARALAPERNHHALAGAL